ncbi:hypothetical protein ACLQ24_13325 [Micromonospora sp. DT4]
MVTPGNVVTACRPAWMSAFAQLGVLADRPADLLARAPGRPFAG